MNCLYMKSQLPRAVPFTSISFGLQELCGLFWRYLSVSVWSLCLAQPDLLSLAREFELKEYSIFCLSKLVCNLLWTCSFSFVCLFCFVLSFLIVNIFTFLGRSLESQNICFSSLGLFRHDDLTQHLGSDFNFRALYKH